MGHPGEASFPVLLAAYESTAQQKYTSNLGFWATLWASRACKSLRLPGCCCGEERLEAGFFVPLDNLGVRVDAPGRKQCQKKMKSEAAKKKRENTLRGRGARCDQKYTKKTETRTLIACAHENANHDASLHGTWRYPCTLCRAAECLLESHPLRRGIANCTARTLAISHRGTGPPPQSQGVGGTQIQGGSSETTLK